MNGQNNIILLTIDCLRSDRLGCLGYNKNITPYIDKFTKKGTLFKQAIANGTNTSSSFCTILSSTYSINHPYKTLINGDKPRPFLLFGKTISEFLKEKGYYTLSFHSNPVLDICNFMRGFIKHKNIYPIKNINSIISKHKCENLLFKIICYYLDDLKPTARARDINVGVMSVLRKKIKKPLFLWVHYMDLHNPYSPERYWPFSTSMKYISKKLFDNQKNKHIESYFYDKELKYCDKYLGELIVYLNKIGYNDDNTLFIISSDHGEEFFEHGEFFHSGKPYEELIHVPIIMRGLNIKKGFVYKKTFDMINLSPTILNYVNLEIPSSFKGKCIDINTNNKVNNFNGVISEYLDEEIQSYSYRMEKWKYILTFYNNHKEEELYDLSKDPREKNNLSHKKKLKKIFYKILNEHINKNSHNLKHLK